VSSQKGSRVEVKKEGENGISRAYGSTPEAGEGKTLRIELKQEKKNTHRKGV